MKRGYRRKIDTPQPVMAMHDGTRDQLAPMCCIGANVDPAAVTDPERFNRNLCEGFDEVLALGGAFTPTIQRT